MSVAWMAVISIFSFVVVTALAIGPLFQPDECQYLLGCLGLFASVTLESGYGGALALTTKLTPSQVSWLYVLSIAYYLIISSVILNAVTGLIIDSFGAQREARESNEEEMNNNW